MILKNNSLEDLNNISNIIKNEYWHHKIFLLKGDLGIGKTELIKILLKNFVNQEVKSPTFNILNKYIDKNNDSINYWHFDLYKKKEMELWEMEELGFYLLLEKENHKCFIEWPERLTFPLEGLKLNFLYINNNNKHSYNDRIIEIIE
jgi:tRNA threonylcarbamoyl adenosine modification protein YjeE